MVRSVSVGGRSPILRAKFSVWISEGLEADRLEDISAAHPQVAPMGVGAGVGVGVPDMKAFGRGIGELDEVVELAIESRQRARRSPLRMDAPRR